MENRKVIIDSNILISFYYENDILHNEAVSIMKELSESLLYLPYCVISEVSTILTYKFGKEISNHFLNDVEEAENILIIDNSVIDEISFYKRFKERLSFTDISLLYLSYKYNIPLITFDRQLLALYKKRKNIDLI